MRTLQKTYYQKKEEANEIQCRKNNYFMFITSEHPNILMDEGRRHPPEGQKWKITAKKKAEIIYWRKYRNSTKKSGTSQETGGKKRPNQIIN